MRNSVIQAVEHYVKPKRPKVLLAEDDEDLRDLIVMALESDGYEVVQAQDGAQLLKLIYAQLTDAPAGTRPPALIISDIMMPGLSGLSVLSALRQADTKIPVVLMTGSTDSERHAEACRLGASAVFQKPFEAHDLRMAVLNLLPAHLPGDEERDSNGRA